MTDARLPERYLMDRRVVRLTDSQFRSFVMATLWSVSNRTDGRIEPEDLALIPTLSPADIRALVDNNLWTPQPHGWLIADFATTQTSRHDLEVLENVRRADREKKARKRAAASSTTGDSPRDTSPGTTQERQGQERQGQAGISGVLFENEIDFETGEVFEPNSIQERARESWQTVADPGYCTICGGPLPCRRNDKRHQEQGVSHVS